MIRITRVPCTPAYIKGVINLRGEVLPVIDLRLRLGMTVTQMSPGTCILVLEINLDNHLQKAGVIVDSVCEVHEIEAEDILPPPLLGLKYRSDFITGLFKSEETFIMLLQMDRICGISELEALNTALYSAEID